MNDATVIFMLTAEQVQQIAENQFHITLTQEEMEVIKDDIDNSLVGYKALRNCIGRKIKRDKNPY